MEICNTAWVLCGGRKWLSDPLVFQVLKQWRAASGSAAFRAGSVLTMMSGNGLRRSYSSSYSASVWPVVTTSVGWWVLGQTVGWRNRGWIRLMGPGIGDLMSGRFEVTLAPGAPMERSAGFGWDQEDTEEHWRRSEEWGVVGCGVLG